MTDKKKWQEIIQVEDEAYFKGDLVLSLPEGSYSVEKMWEHGDGHVQDVHRRRAGDEEGVREPHPARADPAVRRIGGVRHEAVVVQRAFGRSGANPEDLFHWDGEAQSREKPARLRDPGDGRARFSPLAPHQQHMQSMSQTKSTIPVSTHARRGPPSRAPRRARGRSGP